MNFSLTDEQVMIRDSAQAFLAETCSSEAIRAAMDSPQAYDPAVWQSIAQELGWCGLAVAEDRGGLGLGPVELMLVQEQAGYRLLCAPFFSTACLATTLLNEAADDLAQAAFLPAVAAGESLLSAPLPSELAAWTLPQLRASAHSDGWSLQGRVRRVPDAMSAEHVLVTAMVGDELALFSLEVQQPGVSMQPLPGWDASRRFTDLDLQDVKARRCDAEHLRDGLRRAAVLLRLYLAAEQLGAAQRCLDLTLAYVQERKQFGRIVGSFQAVKHRCAQMMVACENTRSAVYGAAALAAGAAELAALEMEISAARALATETLQFCSAEAIQLHGGVGFTWEYDPQLYFKRARASAHWLGDPDALHEQIAAQLLD